MPRVLEAYSPVIWKLIGSLVVLALMLLVDNVLKRLLRVRFGDSSHVHTLRMLIRNTVFFVGSIGILVIWLGFGSSFTVAMGILGAGIAFASQEVIGSFAGYLNIVTGNLFRIGDRVRIGNVVGDVLDISILRTTLMEIGDWVKADQYTGRIVTLANRVVFSDPVFNYTYRWPYLWDEITIPVTYASDWRRAVEIMLARCEHYVASIQDQAEAGLHRMIENYPIHDTSVEPMVYIVLTDNWIQMTLRYVVDVHQRRALQGQLHRDLLERFEAEPDITVASATVEIVGFPPLRSESAGNS